MSELQKSQRVVIIRDSDWMKGVMEAEEAVQNGTISNIPEAIQKTGEGCQQNDSYSCGANSYLRFIQSTLPDEDKKSSNPEPTLSIGNIKNNLNKSSPIKL